MKKKLIKRFTTFTDESGILNKRKFIVATAIVNNSDCEYFQQVLEEIEKESGKKKKWADIGVMGRASYTKLLLKKDIFSLCTIYYGVFFSKSDYVSIVSKHVADSIKTYANNETYNATIFLDKVNNRMTEGIQKSIKRQKIRFKKIRALDDTNNVGLKFIDAMCGLIRDINNVKVEPSYKKIFEKLQRI